MEPENDDGLVQMIFRISIWVNLLGSSRSSSTV